MFVLPGHLYSQIQLTNFKNYSFIRNYLIFRTLEYVISEINAMPLTSNQLHNYGFPVSPSSDFFLLYSLSYGLVCQIWQYGLWSFQTGGTKLERFLPKNQHTQRKLLNFENWINGEVSKIGHHFRK